MGKLNKHFPSKEMYLLAFAMWSAIRQAYDPDPSFSAALFMHITKMLTLTANLEWPKVLRYELLFFTTHQTSKSTTVWANADTSLYVTAGLKSCIEQLGLYSRIEQLDWDKLPCIRYNRPGKGCDPYRCRYAHVCNAGPIRCRGPHPAFKCSRNDRRDDRRDYLIGVDSLWPPKHHRIGHQYPNSPIHHHKLYHNPQCLYPPNDQIPNLCFHSYQ